MASILIHVEFNHQYLMLISLQNNKGLIKYTVIEMNDYADWKHATTHEIQPKIQF